MDKTATPKPVVKVDIWSDVFCPYCFIGKHRLFNVAQQAGYRLDVVWHSFELNPSESAEFKESLVTKIAKKYGMTEAQSVESQKRIAQVAATEGIDFQWQKARPTNSFDAHRLIHLAASFGLANDAEEELFLAYMTQGKLISDRSVLQSIGEKIGIPASTVKAMLESNQFTNKVRQDELMARELGISGVPFFIFNDRLTVSGAQSRTTFKEALQQAATDFPLHQANHQTDSEAISSRRQEQGAVCNDEYCEIPAAK
jgi:predicted DsbA family dithiol-disulfide isomerase